MHERLQSMYEGLPRLVGFSLETVEDRYALTLLARVRRGVSEALDGQGKKIIIFDEVINTLDRDEIDVRRVLEIDFNDDGQVQFAVNLATVVRGMLTLNRKDRILPFLRGFSVTKIYQGRMSDLLNRVLEDNL